MNARKNIYETIFVLHPELTEEDVEANIQSTVQLLEGKGAEIIRLDRGGKRRLAYVMRKQRYGYYNLIHLSCAISLYGLRKRNSSPALRVSLTMKAATRTVTTVAGVDDVASLSICAGRGAIHGVVLWRRGAATAEPAHLMLLSR